MLKSNGNINLTKNKATQLCDLLGTSVNTTNNIIEKYNKQKLNKIFIEIYKY